MLIRKQLILALEQALLRARESGSITVGDMPDISIERPARPEHGDFACSLPLKLARMARLKPMDVAGMLINNLPAMPDMDKVAAAPPGFINFTLGRKWLAGQVKDICDTGEAWGDIKLGDKKAQLEFVSGNPTGPLHVGHGRGAVLGSTLANVMRSAGYTVSTEYYVNDAGAQLDAFNRSLMARYRQCLGQQAEIPDNGYHGNYMVDIARSIADSEGERFLKLPPDEAAVAIGRVGMQMVMALIEADLKALGVPFDIWFSEKSLFDNGQYELVLRMLRDGGHIAERENATWFTSTNLGDDRDNVLIRSDGTPTYFATDIAYHYNKFVQRKFDLVIDIWGADHQGHVPRMKSVMNALGLDPEMLKIIICQLVTLRRGQDVVKVSKRSGDMVTLRDLIDEVGADACRFVFLSRSASSQMDFDLDLAIRQSSENPVYYVQYAHARICSILKNAAEKGISFDGGDVGLLTADAEMDLIRQMLRISEVIETVAVDLAPHHLPFYAQELATAFHQFYKLCRVISDDAGLTMARLKLVQAARIVLAKTLHLMGMTAPESM